MAKNDSHKKQEPITPADAKSDFERKKRKWDADKEKFEKATAKKHTSSDLPDVGRYARGGSYRRLGYAYIHASGDRRQTYDVPADVLGERLGKLGRKTRDKSMVAGSKEHGALYRYEQRVETGKSFAYNFLVGHLPYKNQAHHVIPVGAFVVAFTEKERQLLRKIPYDINHGENIIFLPVYNRDCWIHGLVGHNGSHPDYQELAKTKLSGLKHGLKEGTCEKPEAPSASVLADLIKIQRKMWRSFIEYRQRGITIQEMARAELSKTTKPKGQSSGV